MVLIMQNNKIKDSDTCLEEDRNETKKKKKECIS
jgi:hypothetical protein